MWFCIFSQNVAYLLVLLLTGLHIEASTLLDKLCGTCGNIKRLCCGYIRVLLFYMCISCKKNKVCIRVGDVEMWWWHFSELNKPTHVSVDESVVSGLEVSDDVGSDYTVTPHYSVSLSDESTLQVSTTRHTSNSHVPDIFVAWCLPLPPISSTFWHVISSSQAYLLFSLCLTQQLCREQCLCCNTVTRSVRWSHVFYSCTSCVLLRATLLAFVAPISSRLNQLRSLTPVHLGSQARSCKPSSWSRDVIVRESSELKKRN